MKIRPVFAWYDLWVGAYWDRSLRWLYLLPLPCVGIVIQFRPIHRATCGTMYRGCDPACELQAYWEE